MKLLVISAYFESQRGGVELVAGTMARWFARLRHEVTWAATDATSAPDEGGFGRAVVLPAWDPALKFIGVPVPLPRPSAIWRIVAEVRSCDAVVLHDSLYLTNLCAFITARVSGKPVVLIQHIGHIAYKNRVLQAIMTAGNRLVTRNMLTAAEQVVFISYATAAYFDQIRFRTPPVVVFNGVDADLFRPAAGESERAALKAGFGLKPDRPLVLFVGRFVEKKGLAVIERIARRLPSHDFVLAGRGPIDPAGWALSNVIVQSELDRETLASFYRASDLFLLPSHGEGYPLVIQEALASGIPVLCSAEIVAADPGIRPLVTPVALDLADHAASANAFALALPLALQDAAASSRQRTQYATSNYSWHANAERILAIVEAISAVGLQRRDPCRALRFAGVSIACACLNLVLLAGGDAARLHYLLSGVGSFIAVLLFRFFAHTRFTYATPSGFSAFRRYASTMTMNLPLHVVILWLVCGVFGGSAFVGELISLVCLSAWNYMAVGWAMMGLRHERSSIQRV